MDLISFIRFIYKIQLERERKCDGNWNATETEMQLERKWNSLERSGTRSFWNGERARITDFDIWNLRQIILHSKVYSLVFEKDLGNTKKFHWYKRICGIHLMNENYFGPKFSYDRINEVYSNINKDVAT